MTDKKEVDDRIRISAKILDHTADQLLLANQMAEALEKLLDGVATQFENGSDVIGYAVDSLARYRHHQRVSHQ